MAYTIEQLTDVYQKMSVKRQQMLVETDANMQKIADMIVGLKDVNADQQSDAYLLLRNTKELQNGYQTKRDEALKESIETIGSKLLKRLNDQGVKSMRAQSCTFYKELDHKPSVADWSAFYSWIKENDAFEYLEKRVTKKAIVDYLIANKGGLPPGVNINQFFVVRVRKGAEA